MAYTLQSTLFVVAALLAARPGLAAESGGAASREIILDADADPASGAFTDAQILPVPDSGTIFALRADSTGEPLYRFSLDSVNVYNLLGTLSQTLYDPNDTAAMIRHGERLTLWDDSARLRYIDITADELTLAETLDLVSLASGCNIYVTNRTIVVDRCD